MLRTAAANLAAHVLLAAALLAGCATSRPREPLHPSEPPGTWHVLAAGESVEDVARAAGVPVEDVLELNGLDSPAQAPPGRLIFVLSSDAPRAPDLSELRSKTEHSQTRAASPPAPTAYAPEQSQQPAALPRPAAAALPRTRPEASFRWPLDKPVLTSPFGTRGGRVHEGIDLAVPVGTPVLAAGEGEVLYVGDGIRGYGNLIVVQHPGDVLSVYAHNSELLVRQGDRVAAGQRVAMSGQSGRATAPHLHFELRQGQTPRDPMTMLPPLETRP